MNELYLPTIRYLVQNEIGSVKIKAHHWTICIAHPYQVARIHNQVTVSKHRASFTDTHIRITCTSNLFSWIPHYLKEMHKLRRRRRKKVTEAAQNCPFLTLITRPVLPAATSKSVWRHRNAGICIMSATRLWKLIRILGNIITNFVFGYPTNSAWLASWISVIIGTSKAVLTASNICMLIYI